MHKSKDGNLKLIGFLSYAQLLLHYRTFYFYKDEYLHLPKFLISALLDLPLCFLFSCTLISSMTVQQKR